MVMFVKFRLREKDKFYIVSITVLPIFYVCHIGAWIITGGSHAGVMKQVGEAVRDFCMGNANKKNEIVTIGIATWGIVHNRNSLISTTVSINFYVFTSNTLFMLS